MATRSTTKSFCHESAFVIIKDSEPEMDDPSSSAPVSNITQCKKAIQYVDQVQFDSIQKTIKQLAGAVSRIANNNSNSISTLCPTIESSLSPVPIQQHTVETETSQNYYRKLTKIPSLRTFSNNSTIRFHKWEIKVFGKLEINANYYKSETARIYLVYNCIEGDARSYLYPQYQRTSSDRFKTADNIIDYLCTVYVDPYRLQTAKLEY